MSPLSPDAQRIGETKTAAVVMATPPELKLWYVAVRLGKDYAPGGSDKSWLNKVVVTALVYYPVSVFS